MALSQTIVKPLVVGVVKALLLERPLQVPINLGHENEAGLARACSRDGGGPEIGGPDSPGPLEHIGKNQHRHVAANAVAHRRDVLQFAGHGLLQSRVGVI